MAYLTISDELDKRLSALAEKAGVPKEEYAFYALLEFVEDQEDYLIALSRSECIENGEDKTIPFQELVKKHKLF